jgi:hypothetical protein
VTEGKRQRRRPRGKNTPPQAGWVDDVVPLTHRLKRLLQKHGRGLVIGLGAAVTLFLSAATFYYSYWYERSGLIVRIDRAWLEADLLTHLNASVARGTFDVGLIFSNDGNRPVIIQNVRWQIRSIYATDPDGCDMEMETTEPLFAEEKACRSCVVR